MPHNAFRIKSEGVHLRKFISASGLCALLFAGQSAPLLANPTGGAVVAGSATIGAAGSTLSINQSTQNAIINWQTFSIAGGETTKFIVPNAGATLNRVTGGNPSAIFGNLQSNGTLYLVNPSGIVVGASGRIDTASFLASTLDVSNEQFLAGGNLSFAGGSAASVENSGVIHASTGDVYLIANQVTNKGTLSASKGTVGLAAGSDVLFQQAGSQHLYVQATPAGAKRAVGVTNAGTIRAAAAELKAAGGNAYALAINNTGSIAATGYKKVNGQVYLTSDGGSISNSGKISAKQANGNGGTIALSGTATTSATTGTVTNSGTLDASATVAGGQGGTVSVKNLGGKTVFNGTILAKGGQGGAGGSAEVSGANLQFTGLVDLTAAGGKTGTLTLDPTTLEVVNGGTGAIVQGVNDGSSTISPTTVDNALNLANVTLNADTNITVTSGITWTGTTTLTLSTNTQGSTVTLNAGISGINGGLIIDLASTGDVITPSTQGAISVNTFSLQSGSWTQNSSMLAGFSVGHDFEIQSGSSFLRVNGGDGINTPFQISDVYGLEGLGTYLGANAELISNINATGTSSWNSGEGFLPIGSVSSNYGGTFNGQNFTINGLVANQPNGQYIGVFGELSGGSVVENLNVTNEQIFGSYETGGVVGGIFGEVLNCTTSGSVNGGANGSFIGGIVGGSSGDVFNSSSSDTVSGNNAIGGLVGANGGGTINMGNTSGTVTGVSDVGGLVGADNGGVVENSTSTATVNGTTGVGGLIGDNNGGSVSNSNGNGSVNGNGGSNGGGSSTSTTDNGTPSTTTGGAANGGSNIVPPVLTPQPVSVAPPDNPIVTTTGGSDTGGNQSTPPPFSFQGTGISRQYGGLEGGLADSSGNGGQITSGDTAQLGNGELNNVNNPQAAGTINQALGPIVYANLADALKALGDWADVPDSEPTGNADAGNITVLSAGDVAELGSSGVKNIR